MSRTITVKIEKNDKQPRLRMEQFHAGTLTVTQSSPGYGNGREMPLRLTEFFAMGLISRFLGDHRASTTRKFSDPERQWWEPYFDTIEEVEPGVWNFVLEQHWLD